MIPPGRSIDEEKALLSRLDHKLANAWQRLDHGEPSKELLKASGDFFEDVTDKLKHTLTLLMSQDTESLEVRRRFSGIAAHLLMDLHRFQDRNIKLFPEWYEAFAKGQESWPVLCPLQERKRNEITKEVLSKLKVGQGANGAKPPSVALNPDDPEDKMFFVQQLVLYRRIHAYPSRWGYRCDPSHRIILILPTREWLPARSEEDSVKLADVDFKWQRLASYRKELKQCEMKEEFAVYDEMAECPEGAGFSVDSETGKIPLAPFTKAGFEMWLSDFLIPNYNCFPELFLNHPALYPRPGGPVKGEPSEHRRDVKRIVINAVKRLTSLHVEAL